MIGKGSFTYDYPIVTRNNIAKPNRPARIKKPEIRGSREEGRIRIRKSHGFPVRTETHTPTHRTLKISIYSYICVRNSFEMAKKFTYKTQGTCSKSIEIELEGDIVKSVRFEGGCHGNTQGIGLLTRGMQAADVIARLEGIDCKGRGTSCPDQLAKALASGPRTITATTKPENGPVLQNPGKQRKNKSSYTVSRTAPGNGAADVCRSPGPIVVTGD